MCAAARASRKKRDRTPGVCATFRSITFSATVEFRTVSRALYVIAMAPAPSSIGKPSAPTSTSKWSYFSGPGVNRRPDSDFPGSWLPLRKPRSARQRRHSPFGPTCVSGRPQIAHVPTVGSGSIPVNASALFKSEPRIRSMPFSITPLPFEWFPEGACTRPLSFRADAIPTVLLADFKLLRKRGSLLPRSGESLEPHVLDVLSSAASRSGISDRTFMSSESDRDNEALDRSRPDRKPYSPLPLSKLRDNADAGAKARCAVSRSELQVVWPLLPDLVASCHHRPRMALTLQAIRLCLPSRMHLATVAMRVSRLLTPRRDHKQPNR